MKVFRQEKDCLNVWLNPNCNSMKTHRSRSFLAKSVVMFIEARRFVHSSFIHHHRPVHSHVRSIIVQSTIM